MSINMYLSITLLLAICIYQCNSSSLIRSTKIVMNSNEISLIRSISSTTSRLSDETLLNQAATELKVAPPWNAPRFVWSYAWKLHQFMIPILHFFDRTTPKDSFINLPVLWWKAISGNRIGSKLYDNRIAFDLLPSITRYIVSFPLCYLFPNLHHQNVALRTIYLDKALSSELNDFEASNVIVLGAGYDTRALRYLQKNQIHDFFEFDFPNVMKSKALMLERFKRRRRMTDSHKMPKLYEADLNELNLVQKQLKSLFESINSKKKTIFVVEAVLMYMKDENVSKLLQIAIQEASSYGSKSISIVFADRFPNVRLDNPQDEKQDVIQFFKQLNLKLQDWCPKPGRARHMGIASTFDT